MPPVVTDLYLIAEALQFAAGRVEPWADKKDFQERSLEAALSEVLLGTHPRIQLTPRRNLEGVTVPGWNPPPGAVDLTAELEGRFAFFELKVDNIGDAVWDIAKLACLITGRDNSVAIAAVAARESAWARDRSRAGLFEPLAGDDPSQRWETRFLIEAYRSEWRKALTGNPRPLRLPTAVILTPLGRWSVPEYPEYELRAVAIRAADQELALDGGWPIPDSRTISDDSLQLDDVPDADAALGTILRFAITSNGYTNFGNSERLSVDATRAYEHWQQTGAIPDSLRELRSFLFFHQRAAHFGFGLDEVYVRALVDGIRTRVASRPLAG